MALQKIVDDMRDVTVVDGAKITTGAIPTAALSNVDLVEGTKGADIASAGTMVIGTDGGYFDITGTTGISTMTVAAGRAFTLQFDGAVVLTNSSTLKLSGAANFTTAAGDHLTFISVAANDVRQVGFGLTDGGSPVAGGVAGITSSANATAISIDANEIVTMPKQPCFLIRAASNQLNCTGNAAAPTVAYDTTVFDLNSDIDLSANNFTAPVTGKYLLQASARISGVTSAANAWKLMIVTSNQTWQHFNNEAGHWDQGNSTLHHVSTIICDMDAADTAHIVVAIHGESGTPCDLDGGHDNRFSGCLIA